MKTLFSCAIQISLFCACTCVWGIKQPRPANLSKLSYGENIFKKCQEVDDIRSSSFVDQDTLLCFGLKVYSKQFPGGLEENAVLDGIENIPETDICKHFQEMKLSATLEKLDESVAVYNRQFQDKSTCERACVDIMENVNPLCSIILFLSRQSKGNPSGSGTQAVSTILPGDNADNDNDKADNDNEVSNMKKTSEQSRKVKEEVSSTIPDEQKPKASDGGKLIVVQKTEGSTQEQASKEQKLVMTDGEDKTLVHRTESVLPEQTPQKIKSEFLNDEGKLLEVKHHTGEAGTVSDIDKPKVTNEQHTQVAELAKEKPVKNELQEEKVHVASKINITTDILKKIVNSNKEPKVTTAKDVDLITENGNEGKSDSLTKKTTLEHSSVVLIESSGGNKNGQLTATIPKSQEKLSAGEDSITSEKVVVDGLLQKGESISQLQNFEEGKETDNGQKSQADDKETENPLQKEAELQIISKMVTEVIPKSNIHEQKTNQNSGKAYTNDNAETAPQSGRDDTQKTVSEEIHIPDDTGDQEIDFSVQTGESNDNTEFPSGGGTGADYPRSGSDVLETEKNDMDAGTLVIHEKYDDVDDDSHFFAYFMTTMVFCIVGYLLFHNKQKILALALEGRSRRGRRRPNTSGYRKLDSNLEEAISSSKSASVTQVIY